MKNTSWQEISPYLQNMHFLHISAIHKMNRPPFYALMEQIDHIRMGGLYLRLGAAVAVISSQDHKAGYTSATYRNTPYMKHDMAINQYDVNQIPCLALCQQSHMSINIHLCHWILLLSTKVLSHLLSLLFYFFFTKSAGTME